MPWPPPPGAVEDFRTLCTKCDECVLACPPQVIGLLEDGTPAMDVNSSACHLCPDVPCSRVCPDGALEAVSLEFVFFGLARIEESKCFAFKGPECGACAPACPLDAITMQRNKPVLDESRCNGCGLCREACPVWGKAIVIDT